MMPAIGYHPEAEALAIAGTGVFPALTLKAVAQSNGVIEISSIDGRTEFAGDYTFLMRIDGTTFASQADAMTYLNQQFAIDPSLGSGNSGNGDTIVGVDGGVI